VLAVAVTMTIQRRKTQHPKIPPEGTTPEGTTPEGTTPEGTMPEGTTPVAGGGPLATRSTNLGEVYTDTAGMTLYTFNSDTPGVSNCNDGCATAWPPLLAADDAADEGNFSVITRADGSRQWALHGWPLYYWQSDAQPGDTLGEEVNSLWYVAQPVPVSKWSAEVTTQGTTNTVTVLTDVNRKTLYIFPPDRNAPGGSACNDSCAGMWPPLTAEAGATASGDYTLVNRDDGSMQWAYRGMPLYLWAGDASPGDTLGEEVGDVWYVAQPIPTSKFNTTAQGVVISDTSWRTTYTLDNETTTNLLCTDACLTAWPPLAADAGEINRGDYTTFTNSNGDSQWAYKDKPLYYWGEDQAADDTNGHGLTHPSGNVWSVTAP